MSRLFHVRCPALPVGDACGVFKGVRSKNQDGNLFCSVLTRTEGLVTNHPFAVGFDTQAPVGDDSGVVRGHSSQCPFTLRPAPPSRLGILQGSDVQRDVVEHAPEGRVFGNECTVAPS